MGATLRLLACHDKNKNTQIPKDFFYQIENIGDGKTALK